MIAPSQMQQANTPQSLAQAPIPQVDVDRKRQMAENWKAYRGQFPAPLLIAKGQPDDNVIVNKMRGVVDALVASLYGKVVKIEATDEATGEDDTAPVTPPTPLKPAPIKKPKKNPIQNYLDRAWGNDDDKMTLLSESAINGGVCGQTFIKLIPPKRTKKYPRLVVLDPQIVRVVSHPEDCKLHLAYIIEYPMSNNWQKRQIIARVDPNGTVEDMGDDDIEDTWTITTYIKRSTSTTTQDMWIQTGTPEIWPYPFAPIFTCPNLPNPNENWGIPSITPDLIAENKVLNFLYSNLARIIKYHGHPITWASGMVASQLTMSVDGVICLPSPDSKLEKLAAMDHFDGILAVIESVMSNIDEESHVPSVAIGRLKDLPKGNISGVALQLLFHSLMTTVLQMQRLYGKMMRDISRAMLVIAGLIPVEDYEDYQIELNWPNLLPTDDTAAAQTALLYKQLGISDDTILQLLGFDPDDEKAKSVIEDAQKMVDYSRGQGFPPAPPTSPNQQPPAPGQPQTAQNAQQAVGVK